MVKVAMVARRAGVVLVVLAGVVLLDAHWGLAQESPAGPAAAAPTATPAPASPAQVEVPRVFRDAWEIVVDGKAETNGVLELVYQPTGGEAKLVRVTVVAKAKAKDVAEDLGKELAFTAGEAYKVKVKGDTVVIKRKDSKKPAFFLGIEKQALTGLSVRLSKG